jgi:hypothetical protein
MELGFGGWGVPADVSAKRPYLGQYKSRTASPVWSPPSSF